MAKICNACNKKIGFREQKIPFEDINENEFFLCSDCYIEMPIVEKKKLKYIGKWQTPKLSKATGFMIGGVVGGFAYGDGYRSGREWVIKGRLKKHGRTQQDLDNFSIEKYNVHFWLLPENTQNEILKEKEI